MFSPKYLSDIKPRNKHGSERKYNFARLYFMYKDFDAAQRYVEEYLETNLDSAPGHKLAAQIYEAIGKEERALHSYQESLKLDCSQDDVLLKICDLLVVHPNNPDTMKFWAEKCERVFPMHETVRRLKDCIGSDIPVALQNGNHILMSKDPARLHSLSSRSAITNMSSKTDSSLQKCTEMFQKLMNSTEALDSKILSLVSSSQTTENRINTVVEKQNSMEDKINEMLSLLHSTNENLIDVQSRVYELEESMKKISVTYESNFNTNDYLSSVTSHYESALPIGNIPPNISLERSKPISIQVGNNESTVDGGNVNVPTSVNSVNTLQNADYSESNYNQTKTVASTWTPGVFSWTQNAGIDTTGTTEQFSMKFQNCDISEAFEKALNNSKEYVSAINQFNQEQISSETPWQCETCGDYNTDDVCAKCNADTYSTQDLNTNSYFQLNKDSNADKCGVGQQNLFRNISVKTDNKVSAFSFATTMLKTEPLNDSSPATVTESVKSPERNRLDISRLSQSSIENTGESGDDGITFKPVIPLPPKVEVKTGEEDEKIIFSGRAKLHRFVQNEWKERGTGDLKILFDPTVNRYRLVMRRDQVLKVCLNHVINEDIDFIPKATASEPLVKSYQWSAIDHSDDVATPMVFNVRFKNAEIAKQFIDEINKAKETLKNSSNQEKDSPRKESPENKPSSAPLTDLFKPAANSWECSSCYVRNDGDCKKCVACESLAPLSEVFKPSISSWQCTSCYVQNDGKQTKCLSCESPKPGTTVEVSKPGTTSSFKFGFMSNSPAGQPASFITPVSTTASPGLFSFSSTTKPNETSISSLGKFVSDFQFGATSTQFGSNLLKDSTKTTSVESGSATTATSPSFSFKNALSSMNTAPLSAFKFGSSQSFSFNFSGVNSTPNKISSPPHKENVNSPEVVDSPEAYNSPDNTNDDSIHFKPVVPLPPKVDVKTGEEDEEILFNERAKLYRFTNGEWKERGLGELKVLKDNNARCRLLMRRDQILKVCLNHNISDDLELKPKSADNKSEAGEEYKLLQWSATDYSDGTASPEIFTVRFKTHAIAKKFEDTVKQCKSTSNVDGVLTNNQAESVSDDSDDLQIVYIKEPEDKELIEKAKKLYLPINFFSYKNSQPCSGCYGCRDEIPKLFCEIKVNVVETQADATAETNFFSKALASHGNPTPWKQKDSTTSWASTSGKPVFQADNEGEIDFKPVIPLPELVKVVTGEEEEVPVFSQRGKLYRYDSKTKQWKERGVGDFKILKHYTKKTYRLLLRRDQVLKIACNHYLNDSITFTPMPTSENAVCWYAVDYSEAAESYEQFAIRFKNKQLLEEFLSAVDKAKADLLNSES